MRAYSREELLALTPDRYLAAGFDAAGLSGEFATAAAYQLLDSQVAPQELSFMAEALDQTLPLHHEPPPERMAAAVEEALGIVKQMIRQPNNDRLVDWLDACVDRVQTEDDISALLDHITAVRQQYALIASFAPLESSSSLPS